MANVVSLLGITTVSSTHQCYVKNPHTVPYLVHLGGGVEGSFVEWGLLLALVPILEGDTHHRGEGRGRAGEGQITGEMIVNE